MKKIPKSLQALVVTVLVGMFIPKMVELSTISLINAFVWKIILCIVFNLSTFIVGCLFTIKLIHNKIEGGKLRITIYLFSITILLCFITPISEALKILSEQVIIIFTILSIVLIIFIVMSYVLSIFDKKSKFKNGMSVNISQKVIENKTERDNLGNSSINPIEPNIDHENDQNCLKTIDELWGEFDHSQKYLMITNDENFDLKWIKIYHPRYGNGKYYGYIMMKNARNTVNGEIYYADSAIWKLYGE